MVSRQPPADVTKSIEALIPQGVPYRFVEALSMATMIKINIILGCFDTYAVEPIYGPGHVVILQVAPPKESALTGKDSPLWDKIAQVLGNDPYVEHFILVVGKEPFRASDKDIACVMSPEGEKGWPEHCRAADMEQPVEAPAPVSKPLPKNVMEKVSEEARDGRFNDEREFLSKDVVQDIQILLGSSKSSEDFINNLPTLPPEDTKK
jgi:hypothetical protein